MALITEEVFLYPKENATSHRTFRYDHVHLEENPVAVLRRGQIFKMSLKFDRYFDELSDDVEISFNYGPKPLTFKGTQGIVAVDQNVTNTLEENQNNWFANVSDINETVMTLEVYAPVDIPIGVWNIKVSSSLKLSWGDTYNYYLNDAVFFICNPWNNNDLVYMPEEDLLDEYVLADVGKIWMGTEKQHFGRPWVFGQFDYYVLKAIQLMLDRCDLSASLCGNPIKLCRTISKMVNYEDDKGILYGEWQSYPDGTHPTAWTGSVEILKQYFETGNTVKYGQCWVFSGVTTTICRALGIPARSVTNFVSAFDADLTFTVDKVIDENDEELPNETEDSIWNFHVWNDVYMARHDLPPGYGGWQAIDSTPQRVSGQYTQCGPASLVAIKRGHVMYEYDVSFLIATVNSDYVQWKVNPNSPFKYTKVYSDRKEIGKFILTKKPLVFDYEGDSDREDITLQYKPKEGTGEERMSLLTAVSSNPLARAIYKMPDPDFNEVEFLLKDIERVHLGKDFKVTINVTNLIFEVRTIKFILTIHSVYYNGVKAQLVIKKSAEIRVTPEESRNVNFLIPAVDYLGKLVDFSMMKIYAVATVVETSQTWSGEDDFEFTKPTINVTVPEEVIAGQDHLIALEFINPLSVPLTDCAFTVSGPTMIRNAVIPCQNVDPGKVAYAEHIMVPRSPGERILVVTFFSNELTAITGTAKVYVN